MRIDIITLFAEMFEGFFAQSILKRAQNKGLLELNLVSLRQYSVNKYGSVDDYPFGGGAGMVMQIEPIVNCIEDLQKKQHTMKLFILLLMGKCSLNQWQTICL